MAFPLYPQLEVVQTGPGKDDWKVCTFDGEIDYGPEIVPGGARFGVGGGTPPFTKGTMWCLDVLGALKDPNRDTPAKNHWTLVDTASEVRPYCCPTASLIEIDANGTTLSHKWFMISGEDADADQTGTVAVIDFADPNPRWQIVGSILQPLATTKAVLLPDGKVLIGQGVNRSANATSTAGRARTRKKKVFTSRCSIPPPVPYQAREHDRVPWPARHGDAAAGWYGVLRRREPRSAVRPDDPSFPLTSLYAGVLPGHTPGPAEIIDGQSRRGSCPQRGP